MANHFVIGMGEIGKALSEVLEDKYAVVGLDKGDSTEEECDVMHICIPYSPDFIEIVLGYQQLFHPALTIIHSTVPVGTTDQIPDAVHSPCRGVHPNLVEGLRTFVKYFGGKRSLEAAQIFQRLGISTICTDKAGNTEALKLWCTTAYGWNIILEKAVHSYCEQNGLDFDLVYTVATENYNAGYEKLGMGHVRRPILRHVEGPIGGHCVTNNAKLLGDNWLAKGLLEGDTIFGSEYP